MKIDLIGFAWHMLLYVQYLWHVVRKEKDEIGKPKEKVGKISEYGVVVSVFEMDQNWN